MQEFFHSVTLDRERCQGCINCIKRCPTEAIRVRNKKAYIIPERCIDCGECIRVCPHHAKRATCDSLDIIHNFEYTIALPAPSFMAQFNNLEDVDIVLNALIDYGFDQVFEVAKAAEIVSAATRKLMAENADLPRPVISSACPAVTRLIRVRFPGLIDHILPLNAPIEVAARMAKREAAEKTGLPPEKIGAIFISPCPAKVTATKMPLGTEKSAVDGVIAVSDIYSRLLPYMHHDQIKYISEAGKIGLSWGSSGGEASGLINDNYLAADGIENVIRVLEDLEDEKFRDVDFIELNACSGGCVGGVLNVENPYVAKTKLYRIRKHLPVSLTHLETSDVIRGDLDWDTSLEYLPVLKLDEDVWEAMVKMEKVEEIVQSLEGLDCGSCGAPSCRALAEDIVRGTASIDDCIFRYKNYVPAPFRTTEPEKKEATSDDAD